MDEKSAKEYFLEFIDDREKVYKEITKFSKSEMVYYKRLLEHLKLVNSNRQKYSNAEKGEALQKIVSFLIDKSSVFKVKENIHTSSNEIDQLVMLNSTGIEFQNAGYLNIRGEYFLGECKNHFDRVGVSWVGKLYSLLSALSCKLGIMFSYHGLTGTGWHDATGLTKMLFLSKERLEDRVFIVEFNINDYEKISDGISFLSILEAKMDGMKTDTNFTHHISKHPAESNARRID